jgi:hypothetical protein
MTRRYKFLRGILPVFPELFFAREDFFTREEIFALITFAATDAMILSRRALR